MDFHRNCISTMNRHMKNVIVSNGKNRCSIYEYRRLIPNIMLYFRLQNYCKSVKCTSRHTGRSLSQPEIVPEGDLDAHIAGGAECVGFA